uniref:RNA-directed DNA polymerase n=1 Tax=Ixodes ricinus TaxID=34613 RepID=A0A147BN06_IXORI
MGREGEDVLCSLKLTEDEGKNYETVTAAFEKHFVPRANVIYERARFNRRCQEPHESVDEFITGLHRLAESCEYGPLKDDLIRDRLVVGLLDVGLSEKLQLDPQLTLQTATQKARNSEIVKKQQSELREKAEQNAALDEIRRPRPRKNQGNSSGRTGQGGCKWCGSAEQHSKKQCPAAEKQCNHCGKKGHFAVVCRSPRLPKTRTPTGQRQHSATVGEVYVGEIVQERSTEPWKITANVSGTEVTFKVDTGADVTAIPQHLYDEAKMGQIKKTTKRLLGPGESPIHTVGQADVTIKWNDNSAQEVVYIVGGLREALLGRPAIKALQVLRYLQEVTTVPENEDVEARKILESYPELLSGLGLMETPYRVVLAPGAKPHAVTYPRRVPIPLLPDVERELQRMQDLGVIVKVDKATEWYAPMVVAKKQNGELRICVDYGELNKQIVRERVLMPTVDESLAKLAGAQVFSKLDARAGYWQTPLSKESQEYTTFLTPFGRFQFLRLPFGISTAPEFFQREMLRVLEGLQGQVCLQDDIIVFGSTAEEHDRNLSQVLHRLREAGITLNPDKCAFRKKEVKFLGHIVSSQGIKADPAKLSAIKKMEPPRDVSEVRSYLGMINHLAKFLPGLAEQTKPLRDLLRHDAVWYWGEAQQQAFERTKAALITTPALAMYNPREHLTLSVDASSYGLGAVLLQESQGERRPVAYASRALTETEQRYAQIEKEALAITWASGHFRTYLIGLQFHIETDHKPLVPLLTTKRLDELSPRLQRFRMRLLEYDFTISHIPGKEIHTADVLSRKPLTAAGEKEAADLVEAVREYEVLTVELLPASTDMLTRIKDEIGRDPVTSRVMEYCSTGWPSVKTLPPEVRRYFEIAGELSIVQGLLFKGNRLVVPPVLRNEVLDNIHTGHQGVARCRARAREAVWWPDIGVHIENFVRRCPTCREERKPGAAPLLQTPLPERPWEVIGMDLFSFEGDNYLVVVDYFSRFFELVKLRTTTTKDITKALRPMFARFGTPDVIRSDNGPQFASADFKSFTRDWSIKHVTSSPYYPQSNGAAERTVQTGKQLLRKSPDVEQALLAHRATPGKEGYSPAELIMGRKVKTSVPAAPGSLRPHWSCEDFRTRNAQYRRLQAQQYNKRHRAVDYEPIQPDTRVKIFAGAATHGRVVHAAAEPRSYVVETASGTSRRTQRHLQPAGQPTAEQAARQPAFVDEPSINGPSYATPKPKQTRRGRQVRRPARLDL